MASLNLILGGQQHRELSRYPNVNRIPCGLDADWKHCQFGVCSSLWCARGDADCFGETATIMDLECDAGTGVGIVFCDAVLVVMWTNQI